ncbi:MAG: serine/threonine protein kinase [Anaerolineae bacterium]
MSQFPSISGYRILEIAGRGGMSTVYRAIQLDTGREVALKLISSGKQNWLTQFGREAEIIASLEHPHILPVYDFGTSGEQPYLVMRLLEGGSLADWVKSNRKPDAEKVVEAVTNMAEALDFSHARGILHRDVKPSNMLLDQNGFVYLSDFGLAVFPSDGEQRGLGSAAYISPEQARGEDIDGRADIYSLAVTLFELLTGEKPYKGETPVAVMVKQINEPVPNARDINPEISKAVAELVQWGMSKKPRNRPQSAGQFKELLQYAKRNPNAPVRPSRSPKPSTWPTVAAHPRPNLDKPAEGDRPDRQKQAEIQSPKSSTQWQVILLALLVLLITFMATALLWFMFVNPGGIPGLSTPTVVVSTPETELSIATPVTPIAGNEKTIYVDRFDVDTLPGDLETGTAFVDGALQIQPEGQETLLWASPQQSNAVDGLFRIELLPSDRSDSYQIGLICRRVTATGAFDFTGFFIEKIDEVQTVSTIKIQNGEQIFLDTVEIPQELKITDIGTHKLELRCLENEIEFFIDEFRILSSRDENPVSGVFGVFTANLAGDGVHVVRFDNVEIERP